MRPDSIIALRAALGVTRGGVNAEMTGTAHKHWLAFKKRWGPRVRYAKVKGHSNDKFNDIANELADKGAKGVIGNQKGRWDPAHRDPLNPRSDATRWVPNATRSISIYHQDGIMFIDSTITCLDDEDD